MKDGPERVSYQLLFSGLLLYNNIIKRMEEAMKNPKYCIKQCPIGVRAREKFMQEAESISDAAIDMWEFVDSCVEKGCEFEKERADYEEACEYEGFMF